MIAFKISSILNTIVEVVFIIEVFKILGYVAASIMIKVLEHNEIPEDE